MIINPYEYHANTIEESEDAVYHLLCVNLLRIFSGKHILVKKPLAPLNENCEKLMETKARSLKDDPQARLKMLRFGMGRGYSYEEVAAVTDRIIERWKDSES